MKVRIKFSKQGTMKFIGHLDIMRYFQKAIRRADIAIKYSEGYSPHQIMSFAAPLGVGLTSTGEYMDIEVEDTVSCLDIQEKLGAVMVEGMEILSCHHLADTAKNAMSIVAAADYTVTFRDKYEPDDLARYFKGLKDFFSKEQILVIKKSKKGEREVDLKEGIYELKAEGNTVFMKLSSGSANNIKPELVMDAYTRFRGESLPQYAFQVERQEIYGNMGDDTAPNLIPLAHMGEITE